MTTSSTTSTAAAASGTTGSSYSSTTSNPLISVGEINVTQLVSELMVVQSQPLTQLQNQESSAQSELSAYGQEQSALSSLQTAVQALADPTSFEASSATVTGSGVSAVVTGEPPAADYNVTVSSLASAQSIASAPVASATTTLGTGTLTIQPGSVSSGSFVASSSASPITVTIDSTNDTLSGIAAAINAAAGGTVSASVVTNADGSSQLVVSSANTGTANAFSLSASSSLSQFSFTPDSGTTQAMTQTQAAADAQFTVNGLAMTASSNSVTAAISGVTLNLTQAPAAGAAPLQAQVSVAVDPTTVANTVSNFVSAYNSLVSTVNNLTSYNSTTNTASVLTGDTSTGLVMQTLQSILGGQTSAAGTTSADSWLAEVGIGFNSDGTLSFNSTQFQSALSANPSAVQAMFSGTGQGSSQQGFGVQLQNAITQILSPTGAIGAAQANLQSQLTYMNTQQTLMQAQLAQTQVRLTNEYAALNAAVAAGQEEQTQLSGELANLPGG